jgi:hypothetical protein
MNQDIKELWVNALRSGDYEQTTEALRTKSGFCCLGVLCDIVSDRLNTNWKLVTHDDGFITKLTYSFGNSDDPLSNVNEYLPSIVAEYVELEPNPSCHTNTAKIYLTELNDSGSTFSDIADIIEQYF